MENNIIDVADIDQEIYRIFSIERFKQLISTNELVLVNPSKWDDPFENFFLNRPVISNDGETGSIKNIADSWYGQCWTFNKESDALWRIYSPNKDGIRVSTTIRKLFSNLWDDEGDFSGLKYFIGKVSYKERSEIEDIMKNNTFWDMAFGGQNDNFAKLLCIKRPEFSHEKEVRLLINDTEDNSGRGGCYKVPFEYKNILNDICLDPRLSEEQYLKYAGEIEQLGCNLAISQSELYKIDLSPIRLQ